MINNIVEENPNEGAADDKVRKQARQLAYDVRYKVKAQFKGGQKADPASLKRAYLSQLGKSPAPGPVKQLAKKMLIGEEYDFVNLDVSFNKTISSVINKVFVEGIKEEEPEILEEDGKYKIRVTDKKSGKSYVRMADRSKIAELRKNPNISSVEMTGYGSPYDKADGKGSSKKKAKKDFDGDGKVESPTAEYKGSKDKAIKKAVAKEGYQRDPEKLKKDKTHSKQPDPSKDGFTGIGNMSIKDIMKMNKKMKKEEVVAKESVGSAIDKGLGAVGDTAKVAGKAAVGGVKVASKVVKGTAKAAGRVAGTAVGAVKAVKKGYQSGADANEEVKIDAIDPSVQSAVDAIDEAQSSYDKARKAAARRAADRNAKRRRGEMGGNMERETYTNEAGTRMHHKGYRANANEEVELDPSVQSALSALDSYMESNSKLHGSLIAKKN